MYFYSDFVNLLRKWGPYQPLAIWKVHYLYTTLPQTCHCQGPSGPPGEREDLQGLFYLHLLKKYNLLSYKKTKEFLNDHLAECAKK
jgi:hypothetical protein